MSAGKMYLTEQIQSQTEMLRNEFCGGYLQAYFPAEFTDLYKQHLSSHPLADEITATMISNYLINQAGCGFLSQDDDMENGGTLAYVKCYLTFDRVLEAQELRKALYALDNTLPTNLQYRLLLQIENTLSEFSRWAVLHHKSI